MKDIHTLLKGRFAVVRSDLVEILDHAEGLDLTWAPAEGMRTLGGQLLEIAATEVQFIENLEKSLLRPYEEVNAETKRSTLGEYRTLLETIRKDTLRYIDSLSAEHLQAEIEIPSGWWEGLGQPSVPRAEVLRSLAAHEWYHVGQLTSYLWVAGRDPYSW